MPRFVSQKDFNFFQHINRELLVDVVDVDVILYKIALETTAINIYGESTEKTRYTGVELKALIKSGLTGKPLVASLETHWNRGEEYYSKGWRGTWKGEQGGAILSHSIHIHDLMIDELDKGFNMLTINHTINSAGHARTAN